MSNELAKARIVSKSFSVPSGSLEKFLGLNTCSPEMSSIQVVKDFKETSTPTYKQFLIDIYYSPPQKIRL